MSKRKACLVINPRGGANVAKMTDILAVLAAGEYQTRVVLKEYGGHTLELSQQAAEEKCDMIVAYGGDGTLNQVVNGVLNAASKSVVGVLPGGTANLWASEIGVPTDNAARAALALLNSQARRVDVGCVSVQDLLVPTEDVQAQDKPTAQEKKTTSRKRKNQVRQATRRHFLLMAGLGLDAAVIQGVSKPLKYKIKQLAVGLSAARELPAYQPFPMEVRTGGGDLLWRGEA
ncbi:MAG: diacylglycerol/lipid kinase family protein, partial [Ktedonobacteraceae bacterium]